MRDQLALEHRIPRYNAFSTPEEKAAYIDATASSLAILSYAADCASTTTPRSPTLSEISFLAQNTQTISPTQSEIGNDNGNKSSSESKSPEEHLHDRVVRLTAMFTLYNLARTCEGIEERDWAEYITPYEEGDLEMLERVCPREW